MSLNSDHNLNYSAGFVFVKLIPEYKVIQIGVPYSERYLMADFLKVSKKTWKYDWSQLYIKDDCNLAIHYDDAILNNYLMWYIEATVFERLTLWQDTKKNLFRLRTHSDWMLCTFFAFVVFEVFF